jgi:hypothetical protein
VDGSFDACATAELAETIGQLHALEAAVHRVLLAALASFDRRYGWEEDGATSAVAWLTGMLGVSWRTASDWLEVAKALEDLPAIGAAYGEGRLSADQVRALVAFATPESEADLAQAAAGWSAAHTAAIARRARPVTPEEADDAHRRRSLRMWWGEDRCLHVRGRLPDAAGAVVVQAVERIADQAPPDPATGLFEPYESRCADALVTMAAGQVSADPDVDRATVVVHADVSLLTGEGAGPAEIDGGPVVAAETARRLACDGRWASGGRPGRCRRGWPGWCVAVTVAAGSRGATGSGGLMPITSSIGDTDRADARISATSCPFAGSTTGRCTRAAGGSRASLTAT